MINFLSSKLKTFGLEISNSSLKVARIKELKKGLFLSSFGETDLISGTIIKGKIKNESALVSAMIKLKKNVKGEKLGTNYVSISLPEERSFIKIIKMPKIDKEDLKEAIFYEAENHLPLPLKDVYLDFQVLSSSKENLNLLITALPREVVDPCVAAVEKAGFFPVSLETESLAIVRSLINKTETLKPILVVDIGQAKTSFMIFSGGSICFSESIQISSEMFTQEIAQSKSISLFEAEEFKITNGIYEEDKESIIKDISLLINDLTKTIKRYLEYYSSEVFQKSLGNKGDCIKDIIVCGRGSNLKGLLEYLSKEINIEIKKGDPFLKINLRPKNLSPEESLGYAVVIGSALREFYR